MQCWSALAQRCDRATCALCVLATIRVGCKLHLSVVEKVMTSRFRRELTVVPQVKITVSQRDIATTIVWPSDDVDRVLSRSPQSFRVIGDHHQSGPLPVDRCLIPGTRQDFGGGDLKSMTSPGLGCFKEILLATQKREREIRSDVVKAKWQVALSWTVRALAWSTLTPAFSKSLRTKVDTAVAARQTEVANLKQNLAASRVSVSFNMETAVAGPHLRMLEAFDRLSKSSRSWALQTSQQIDRKKARSAAGTVVSRRLLWVGRQSDSLVDTADLPLAIGIQNGQATAFFYPGFVLVVSKGRDDFAIVNLTDLDVSYCKTLFTEAESIPSDAVMIRKMWAKSNKDGSRDRRFKNNRELPVMVYGEVTMNARGGLCEAFMFSRDDASREFVAAVAELQRVLRSGQRLRGNEASQLIGK